MMYKCSSLITAQAIIEIAMQIINSDENMPAELYTKEHSDFRICIECYQNGREHGFLAWPMFKSDTAYYICEARRSDSPCIYKGDYAMQSISEDAYTHSNTFDSVHDAAVWLVTDLIELYNAVQIAKEKK